MKRIFYGLVVTIAILLLLYALRFPILRAASNFLTNTDKPQQSEVMFVLSGSAYDRGTYAAKLYKEGLTKHLICTGGNYDGNMLALGRNYPECELTKSAILLTSVDTNAVELLPKGTSTVEEGKAILNYCKEKNIHSCIVVTSVFHTRRVSWMIKDKLEEQGIETTIAGAPPRLYNPTTWWESEYGLIDLNNEYVKLFYYLLKYGF